MPANNLPPEVCARVAHFTATWPALVALSATSRTFQRAAEPRLYGSLQLTDPHVARRAFAVLARTPRVAALVHTLRFWLSVAARQRHPELPREWWSALQAALAALPNLANLLVYDPRQANAWVLDPARVRLPALREACLRVGWQPETVAFLAAHPQLKHVVILVPDSQDLDAYPPVPSHILPSVQVFDGPLPVAFEIVASPLTHVQVMYDHPVLEEPMMRWVPKLGRLSRTLRALSIVGVTISMTDRIMDLVANHCPQIKHLGLVALPVGSV
jgi:hypothetical protein